MSLVRYAPATVPRPPPAFFHPQFTSLSSPGNHYRVSWRFRGFFIGLMFGRILRDLTAPGP